MAEAIAAPRITIERILNPRSVAVFGASDDRSKWAGRIMYYLALHGYAGKVIPINPRRQVVQGKKCYARIDAAPPVDVAIVAIPAASVPATVRECADAGVGCCLIISSGFAEAGGEGVAAERSLAELSRRTGMRLIGPNCLGLINVLTGMALTSARVLEVDKLYRGPIGIVSQSGAILLSVFNRAYDVGIGFSQLVSIGNQADLEVCDFLEHMIGDPETRVICLHIEGLKDGRRFLELIRRARRAGKPIVALKTGRGASGEAAARSHTASLAGAYAVFEAACRDEGVVLVDDPDVMVLTADMIARFGPWQSGRIGVVSSSGGINGIVADRLGDIDAPLAPLAPATQQALGAFMLPTHLQNPVDLGARRQTAGDASVVAEAAVRIVAADPDVGVVVVPLTTSPNYEATATALAKGVVGCGKPGFIILTPGSVANGVRAIVKQLGCPLCDRIDDGMRMLRAYRDYAPASSNDEDGLPAGREGTRHAMLDLSAGYLKEPEAKALIARYGIPITRECLAGTRDEAVAAADAIGYPVVIKAVTERVVHKSDAGLVRLALADRTAVAAAWDEITSRLAVLDPAADRLVVAEMAAGELELILGAKDDPQFGPVVMVGAGGVLVELFGDLQMALAPIGCRAAEALLRRLRIWPLLDGYRGRPRLDVAAAATALACLSRLAADLVGRLSELDINPLLVRSEGNGVVALDARAVIV